MTRMTGPDCAVMCNLIIKHTCTEYIHNTLLLSTCPLNTNSGCEKERRINWSVVTCQGSTRSELLA